MKVFLLKIEMYDYENTNIETIADCNIYLEFEKARIAGINDLKRRIEVDDEIFNNFDELLKQEKLDYTFNIIEIDDLEYTANFNVNYSLLESNRYLKLEPTHKVYDLDYKGNILQINYEYRNGNSLWKTDKRITVFPEDLEEGASKKFKIGDIVKLKHNIDYRYIDDNMDRIYVVRWLPRKFGGKKYFENKYALISLYEREEENKELFTFEYFEKDLEKYNGKITENSEYEILSRIVKGNLKVSREYWNKVKVRKTSFKYKNFRERKP